MRQVNSLYTTNEASKLIHYILPNDVTKSFGTAHQKQY